MSSKNNRVAIVGGARTPFAKAGTKLKQFDSLALGTHSVDGALSKLDLDPQLVDQLAFGSVVLDPSIPHLAREINFSSQLPVSVRSLSMTDNCITGTSAITSIHNSIALGQADIGEVYPDFWTGRLGVIFIDFMRPLFVPRQYHISDSVLI